MKEVARKFLAAFCFLYIKNEYNFIDYWQRRDKISTIRKMISDGIFLKGRSKYMGMYDYLGGEQIKIFYCPIFNVNKEKPAESSYWHSGGQLRDFGEDDELPLKTLYYQYPNDFMVYDYRFDYTDVWVIRNGKFEKRVPYTELTEDEVTSNTAVYDYNGTLLNIKTLADFNKMKSDFNNRLQEYKLVDKELFPEGSLKMIKTNLDEYERLVPIRETKYKEIDAKYSHEWVLEDPNDEEASFGAMIDCYLFTRSFKDEESIKDVVVPHRDYQACKMTMKRIINENPEIVERFKAWVNDESMLIGLDAVIEDIFCAEDTNSDSTSDTSETLVAADREAGE